MLPIQLKSSRANAQAVYRKLLSFSPAQISKKKARIFLSSDYTLCDVERWWSLKVISQNASISHIERSNHFFFVYFSDFSSAKEQVTCHTAYDFLPFLFVARQRAMRSSFDSIPSPRLCTLLLHKEPLSIQDTIEIEWDDDQKVKKKNQTTKRWEPFVKTLLHLHSPIYCKKKGQAKRHRNLFIFFPE